jgi:hypothetical protein
MFIVGVVRPAMFRRHSCVLLWGPSWCELRSTGFRWRHTLVLLAVHRHVVFIHTFIFTFLHFHICHFSFALWIPKLRFRTLLTKKIPLGRGDRGDRHQCWEHRGLRILICGAESRGWHGFRLFSWLAYNHNLWYFTYYLAISLDHVGKTWLSSDCSFNQLLI